MSTTTMAGLSSEAGVAESGGRHADGAAQAQRAADLIATLGAQNKAQREQIAALKAAISELQQEFKAAEQVHEAAKVSKNAELLDFMKAHAREQQTKQAVAQLRQANAAKWQQVKEEQAKLADLGSQSAKHSQEEAQAAERRRAHAATVEAVRQRAELPEAVLGEEVAAAAARLAEHDKRAAEAQQAEAAERARAAEAAEAAERARRAEALVIRLLLAPPGGGGGHSYYHSTPHYHTGGCCQRSPVRWLTLFPPGEALLGTIQQGVGGSSEALAAVLDTLQACPPPPPPMQTLVLPVWHAATLYAIEALRVGCYLAVAMPVAARIAAGQLRRVPQHVRLLQAALVLL